MVSKDQTIFNAEPCSDESHTLCKVMFWNWNLAPEEPLTEDFIFMPEVWGSGVVNEEWVRQADTTNFLDSHGKQSPATMANLMMGMNEPDIQGSCMGNMFGRCVKHPGSTGRAGSSASNGDTLASSSSS